MQLLGLGVHTHPFESALRLGLFGDSHSLTGVIIEILLGSHKYTLLILGLQEGKCIFQAAYFERVIGQYDEVTLLTG